MCRTGTENPCHTAPCGMPPSGSPWEGTQQLSVLLSLCSSGRGTCVGGASTWVLLGQRHDHASKRLWLEHGWVSIAHCSSGAACQEIAAAVSGVSMYACASVRARVCARGTVRGYCARVLCVVCVCQVVFVPNHQVIKAGPAEPGPVAVTKAKYIETCNLVKISRTFVMNEKLSNFFKIQDLLCP